ncbi:MAG: Flp family type IVb pilin [Verrucomicrobiota bacterium]
MKHITQIVRKCNRRSGQSLVEYALILALIAVVAILVLGGIGNSANNKLDSVNGNLQ